jgi:hypothetical protein
MWTYVIRVQLPVPSGTPEQYFACKIWSLVPLDGFGDDCDAHAVHWERNPNSKIHYAGPFANQRQLASLAAQKHRVLAMHGWLDSASTHNFIAPGIVERTGVCYLAIDFLV